MDSGSGSGGGGGSGSDSSDVPPTLMFGFGTTLTSQPGVNPATYQASIKVPIGTIANITSSGGGGAYSIKTWTWTGGTNYSAYTAAAAAQPPPPSVSLAQNVATNGQSYQFIVDSSPRQYTITLDVTYQNGASGESTLTFTSDAPTGSLFASQVGTQTYAVNQNAGTITVQLSPGISISANVATDQFTGGQFMFMQICTGTLREFTDANGQSFYQANVYTINGQNFDGPLIDAGTLGYAFTYANSNTNYSATVAGGGSLPAPPWNYPTMSDGPALQRFTTDKKVSALDEFSTYLMYLSSNQNAVWIAVSELDWSWSEAASQPYVAPDPNPTQQPAPQAKTPSGSGAFRGWVNTTFNLTNSGFPPGP